MMVFKRRLVCLCSLKRSIRIIFRRASEEDKNARTPKPPRMRTQMTNGVAALSAAVVAAGLITQEREKTGSHFFSPLYSPLYDSLKSSLFMIIAFLWVTTIGPLLPGQRKPREEREQTAGLGIQVVEYC